MSVPHVESGDALPKLEHLERENALLREQAKSEAMARQVVEQKLNLVEGRLQLALDAAGLAVWEWDLDQQTVYTSARFAELVQDFSHQKDGGHVWSMDDLVSKLYAEDRQNVKLALIETLKQNDRGLDVEYRIRTPAGMRWLECTGEVSQRDMLGRGVRMVGIVRNITRRKTAQHEVESARALAVAANSAKDDFLAHISHEIRTPLNGVIGMNNLLAQTELTPEQRQYVDLVASSGRALLALVNDVLDYSRLQAQKLILETVRFPLRRWLWEVVTPLRVSAEGKGLVLQLNSADDLPQEVVGDPGRLRQILTNLLSNAIKFTEIGQIEVSMRSNTAFSGRPGLSIEVIDTGIGIPIEKQQSVFGAFVQADSSTSRRYGGTGLGLSISARLAELMGGRIDLDSAPGRGSRFTLHVPMALPRSDTPATQFGLDDTLEATRPGALGLTAETMQTADAVGRTQGVSRTLQADEPLEAPSQFPGKRALVVDDHGVNRLLASKLLEHLGFDVTAAENGEKALQIVQSERFDLVLMDIQMPVMNGWQATHHIRKWEQSVGGIRVPIIALSAHASAADREQALASGMDGYLSKPLTPDALQAALRATRLAFRATDVSVSPSTNPETKIDSTIDITRSERPLPPPRISLHNRQRLLNRLAGNEDALHEMAMAFCDDLRRCLGVAFSATRSQDYVAVAQQAHALKGLLLGITAEHAAALARNLEFAAKRANQADTERAFAELSQAAKEVFDAVKTW
jgi:signal transduction histidine kinase/DNA-binding response OmpR family regulator